MNKIFILNKKKYFYKAEQKMSDLWQDESYEFNDLAESNLGLEKMEDTLDIWNLIDNLNKEQILELKSFINELVKKNDGVKDDTNDD